MLCWSAKYLISSVLGLQETIVITFASPPEQCIAAGKIPGLACIKGLVGLGWPWFTAWRNYYRIAPQCGLGLEVGIVQPHAR